MDFETRDPTASCEDLGRGSGGVETESCLACYREIQRRSRKIRGGVMSDYLV